MNSPKSPHSQDSNTPAQIFHADRDKETVKADGAPPAFGRPRGRLLLGSPERARRAKASKSTQTINSDNIIASTDGSKKTTSSPKHPSDFPVSAGDQCKTSGLEEYKKKQNTAFLLLAALSSCHLLTDLIQSSVPALYPLLKKSFQLNFFQIGCITLTLKSVGSLFQPIVGFYTDRYPKPYALPLGMGFTLIGLILLATVGSYYYLLMAAACIGFGAAIFHPEASRIAHMASGGKNGLAQSLFQVGGNTGTSLGPLLIAVFIVPHGRFQILWLSFFIFGGILILGKIGAWFSQNTHRLASKATAQASYKHIASRRRIFAIVILVILIFSKYFYLESMLSYYTFFLIKKFHLSIAQSQYFLFLFLVSVAMGTLIGGPWGDRIGRKKVIWVSILGAAPFSLLLPYASLFWVAVLSVIIGVIIASAFSAILVYAQELIPGNVGMVSGLFFGLAFGMGGLGSVSLGALADATSISFVFKVCSMLPLLGLLTAFLPSTKKVNPDISY
ncbi:MAG: MFS transporter [Verrucomicrobiae bacterium]|nr:MFS transporter [Verrucomicrobiae bacterium]